MITSNDKPIVGIVGPCTAGKSTLNHGLLALGIQSRHIAQEHSFVPDMWHRLIHPDVLIFLDVSYEHSFTRKPLNWTLDEYIEQHRRLEHARNHANYYLMTDPFSIIEVRHMVLGFLASNMIVPIHTT